MPEHEHKRRSYGRPDSRVASDGYGSRGCDDALLGLIEHLEPAHECSFERLTNDEKCQCRRLFDVAESNVDVRTYSEEAEERQLSIEFLTDEIGDETVTEVGAHL